MSQVKIRKKVEDRNTPILNFIGIALIPLVLAFLWGFSAGSTGKAANEALQSRIDSLSSKNQLLEDSLNQNRLIFEELKKFAEDFEKGYDEQDENLSDAARSQVEFPDGMEDWERDKDKFFNSWKDRLDSYRENMLKRPNLGGASTAYDYFEEIISLKKSRMESKFKGLKTYQDQTDLTLLQAEIEQLKQEKQLLDIKIETKDGKIELLGSQLATKCDTKPCPDNSDAVAIIKSALDIIKADIVNAIPNGLLGKNKSLKDNLKDEVGKISTAVGKIK